MICSAVSFLHVTLLIRNSEDVGIVEHAQEGCGEVLSQELACMRLMMSHSA